MLAYEPVEGNKSIDETSLMTPIEDSPLSKKSLLIQTNTSLPICLKSNLRRKLTALGYS